MGPGQGNESLPSRPKYAWDMRNAPWTDGRGDQSDYSIAVKQWKAFHDKLPPSNSNKIPSDLQGIILQSQLYGRAKDLCKALTDTEVQSDDGPYKIIKAVHKRDPLAVISEVYGDFTSLLMLKRGQTESFKNFATRFEAQFTKFNSHSDTTKLPDCLLAFMLLANSNLENNQRVSVLAASVPRADESSTKSEESTESFLNKISYSSIAAVVRQCDVNRASSSINIPHHNYLKSASAKFQRKTKQKLTPEQLADLKSKSTCRKCGVLGHWESDHNPDGSLNRPMRPSTNKNESSSNCKASKEPKKTVTFHMVNIPSAIFDNPVGPLLDDGAPYSGMGLAEFKLIQPFVVPDWNGSLDPLPEIIQDRPWWQYGQGRHASAAKRILGAVMITVTSDLGNPVQINHLIIDGSSQWIVGRNVTRRCKIDHMEDNKMELPKFNKTDPTDSISLVDYDLHSYIPYKVFLNSRQKSTQAFNSTMFCATTQFNAPLKHNWSERRKIVDKIHKHVCGHSNFGDMKTLLQRNNLWDHDTEKYLISQVDSCYMCRKAAEPKQARKVSLSSMSRNFNEVVCIDHFFLDKFKVFHIMDSQTRYSVGAVVPDEKMENAVELIDTLWFSPFWVPRKVIFDQAFNNSEFLEFAKHNQFETVALPPRRHNKNVIESKHKIIRDIYIRLKDQAESENAKSVNVKNLIQHAIRVSNDLYGNSVMSAQELAKGYTRPVTPDTPTINIPNEIRQAQEKLQARRKLNLILNSKSTSDIPTSVGDQVEVFVKQGHEKRGRWLSPRPVLDFDGDTGSVTLPGKNGRTMSAALEDIRLAIEHSPLASAIQESMDTMDNELFHALSETENEPSEQLIDTVPKDLDENIDDNDDISLSMAADSTDNLGIGERVEVFWPDDNQFYTGTVTAFNPEDNTHQIDYDDGDIEKLDMAKEKWKFQNSDVMIGNDIHISPGDDLQSAEKEASLMYFERFKYKDFLISHTEGLPSFVVENSYKKEEEAFTSKVKKVHVSKIPKSSNTITSHAFYKCKQTDDGSIIVKTRIAPPGNKDKEKEGLKTDSAVCSPLGIRVLLTLAVIFRFVIAKIDARSAFLQTGEAMRDVYVIPPRECKSRMYYWLLETAVYGLVNSNAKWQMKSDNLFFDIGFLQCTHIPQLFYISEADQLNVLAVKIVDDMLLAGSIDSIKSVIAKVQARYELGTITIGPDSFIFNGLRVTQSEDLEITMHGDEKVEEIEPYPITRQRRKEINSVLTSFEMSSFRSVNGSLGWLGVAASPFYSFASSHLQQRSSNTTVNDLITQINLVRSLKKKSTKVLYKRPSPGSYKLSVFAFSDAGRAYNREYGQLSFIIGILVGELEKGSTFYLLNWGSSKSKRPIKSIGSAEIMAASQTIDEGKIIKLVISQLLNISIDFWEAIDSKDLFDTLTTCHAANDKSIRGDVACIRYDFETHWVNRMTWIPGSCNLTDPLTKLNSPLEDALQILICDGELPISFEKVFNRDSGFFYG